MNITQGVGVVTHQSVLVDLAGLWSEHGLDHELVFVLLGRVELEGLETDGDVDLGVGVQHSGVRLHTVPKPSQNKKTRGNLGYSSQHKVWPININIDATNSFTVLRPPNPPKSRETKSERCYLLGALVFIL